MIDAIADRGAMQGRSIWTKAEWRHHKECRNISVRTWIRLAVFANLTLTGSAAAGVRVTQKIPRVKELGRVARVPTCGKTGSVARCSLGTEMRGMCISQWHGKGYSQAQAHH